ncbi:MAG: hypothetical protein GXO88_11555 [Chlorobi bacterium]|nr:hypothetical protein [Chlorobiota bacterium]
MRLEILHIIMTSCSDAMTSRGVLFSRVPLKSGETKITTSVSNRRKGIYIAKAYSGDGGSGSGKFVVCR